MKEDLRQAMAQAVKQLYRGGLLTPSGGNVSCRCPAGFLITPSGQNKGELAARDLLLVDAQGAVLEGQGRPSIETPMHLAVYAAHPGLQAVIHDHAVSPLLAGAFQLPFATIGLESCPFRDLPRLAFLPPGSPELAGAVTRALGGEGAMLLLNHGALTVGSSLPEALYRAFMLERAASLALWTALLGRPALTIPPELIASLKV